MWYIYILKCADGVLYTGSTTDIDRRVKEHNRKKGGGCTRGRLPVALVHKEPYETRSEAQKREAQIKRWSRNKKLALISRDKSVLQRLSKSLDKHRIVEKSALFGSKNASPGGPKKAIFSDMVSSRMKEPTGNQQTCYTREPTDQGTNRHVIQPSIAQ